jgi:urea transport system permease protein
MKRLILSLLLVLGLAPICFAQDEFNATALRLGGSFGEQAEAVEKLGLSGDPRALPLLQALADGKLARMPDGALRIGDADALTGAPADATGASPVRINNRVRAALRSALGRLQIVSPDPAERLRAADGILRSRSAQDLPLLDAALARETVPRIRERLVLAQGAARLASDDSDETLRD